MQVVYERCCGIDVHKQTVVACVIVPGPDGQPLKETRTFATMTVHLEAAGLVGRSQIIQPCGDGEHGGVLEARIQPAG